MTIPGYNIIFVDTPGFNDNKKLDSDILKMISEWLKITYVLLECTKDAADHSTDSG